ncbi:hypothetical protein B0H17DRAFT_663539 [Mycena rosella]|uniref:Uncharacterized protein n=1 Tax=Mycena rosella TaxID=1033263 RepID=A0AAD7GTX8_MYCRO|nr:hypothetical protein B0H17DRAFT_663539 [Mycena rosella]
MSSKLAEVTFSNVASAIIADIDNGLLTSRGPNSPGFAVPRLSDPIWGSVGTNAAIYTGGQCTEATAGRLAYRYWLQAPLKQVCAGWSPEQLKMATNVLASPEVIFASLRDAARADPSASEPFLDLDDMITAVDNLFATVAALSLRHPLKSRAVQGWIEGWIAPMAEALAEAMAIGARKTIPRLLTARIKSISRLPTACVEPEPEWRRNLRRLAELCTLEKAALEA